MGSSSTAWHLGNTLPAENQMVLNCVHAVFDRCTANSIREGEAWEERKAGGIQEKSSGMLLLCSSLISSTSILTLVAQIFDFSSSLGQSITTDQSKNCCAGSSPVRPHTQVCKMPPWVCGSSPQTPDSSSSPPTPAYPMLCCLWGCHTKATTA